MKKILLLIVALFGVVTLTACVSGGGTATKTDDGLKKGTFVAAKWQDGRYYLATVQSFNSADQKYAIKFVDDTDGTYTKEELVIVPPTLDVKVGDVVSAAYPNSGKFYTGKIKEINDMGVLIEWNDGSADSLLPRGHMVKGELK